MNKILKISLGTVLATLPIQYALAEPYAGLGLGFGMTTLEKQIEFNGTSSDASDQFNSLRTTLFLGYNFRTLRRDVFLEESASSSEFFVALEGDVTYTFNEAESRINNWFLDQDASVKERLRYQADLFLLGKYAIKPNVTVFIGPGITVSKFETDTDSATAGELGATENQDSTVSGWAIKAGVEVEICEGINLVAAYQYASYDRQTFTAIEPLTGSEVAVSYKPIINAVSVGVMFN